MCEGILVQRMHSATIWQGKKRSVAFAPVFVYGCCHGKLRKTNGSKPCIGDFMNVSCTVRGREVPK